MYKHQAVSVCCKARGSSLAYVVEGGAETPSPSIYFQALRSKEELKGSSEQISSCPLSRAVSLSRQWGETGTGGEEKQFRVLAKLLIGLMLSVTGGV